MNRRDARLYHHGYEMWHQVAGTAVGEKSNLVLLKLSVCLNDPPIVIEEELDEHHQRKCGVGEKREVERKH
jgi:hypothetical protein